MGKPGRIQVAWSLKLGLRSYGARINAIPGRKWLAMPGVIQVICRVYTSEQFLTDRCLEPATSCLCTAWSMGFQQCIKIIVVIPNKPDIGISHAQPSTKTLILTIRWVRGHDSIIMEVEWNPNSSQPNNRGLIRPQQG